MQCTHLPVPYTQQLLIASFLQLQQGVWPGVLEYTALAYTAHCKLHTIYIVYTVWTLHTTHHIAYYVLCTLHT